ncbi:MAG: hypothetical protein IJ689_03145 [Alphaproteobacteria bacterium]|nr:hypothetical protein [Alphaproteobacteria bacterium]
MKGILKLASCLSVAGIIMASPLHAQVLGNNAPVAGAAAQGQNQAQPSQAQAQVPQAQAARQAPRAAQPANQQFLQQNNPPQQSDKTNWTLSRGRHIAFGTNSEKRDQELIMMYMKDFRVYRTPSGQTRCSMQFAVVSTLPERISNISYRLQWQGMDTVLSFSNVQPEVENHYNYSLLGDGCYSMDKAPNIVINRCRVKGMSQRDCASKVRWLTRSL